MNRTSIIIAAALIFCVSGTMIVSAALRDGSKTIGTEAVIMPATATTPMKPSMTAGPDDEDTLISAAKARSAPELVDGRWINSDPTTLTELKGKVVYLEFWTFGCFNCINTLPAVKGYDKKFRDKGLTVIGVETPELDFERSYDNLVAAVKKRGIEYPILTDYGSKNWEAYDINAWPSIVIIDKMGRIRYRHIGEGAYETQEKVIETLLAE